MEGAVVETLVHQLKASHLAELSYAGFEIAARWEGDELLLRTPVFMGGNYIPPSVRRCLHGRNSLIARDSESEVKLWIDKEKFQVVLDYRVKRDLSKISSRLEEFLAVADEWRTLLDESGQQDLIHVPIA